MLPFVWVTILARRRKGEMWWLYCGRRILANNKDMVAREGLELPPAAFSGAALWGGIGGSLHAAFELLPQQNNNLAGLPQALSRVPAVPEHNVCLDCASQSDRQIWASNPRQIGDLY